MDCNALEDFQRHIGVYMRKRDDGIALLTGTIRDYFHDILLEVEVLIATQTVQAIRVFFNKAPSCTCEKVSPQLQTLVGMTVGPGMSRRLTEALGGATGCGNLRNLLLSLLPLTINLSVAAGIADEEEMLDAIHRRLVGTCAGYAVLPAKKIKMKHKKPGAIGA